MTDTVKSADGTTIAYDATGAGVPLVLVGGALSTRRAADELTAALEPHFTVYSYDRRGRGDSGDTAPYAIDREVEDLAALITAAGGSAYVYGHSSGAVLALEAASRSLAITKLVAYEPPFTAENPSGKGAGIPLGDTANDVKGRVRAALDAGHPDEAVQIFMRTTGMDDAGIAMAKELPFWPDMVELAHSIPYDLTLVGDGTVPTARFAAITAPTLVMDGGMSAPWASRAAAAVVDAVPGARQHTLEGQDHGVEPAALVPVLVEFFA